MVFRKTSSFFASSTNLLDRRTTMSYTIKEMVYYDQSIKKDIKKGIIPGEIARLFHHAFVSLDATKDLNIFDVKKLVTHSSLNYYRLRKGKYRAIFYMEGDDFYVITIGKRSEVYQKWQ